MAIITFDNAGVGSRVDADGDPNTTDTITLTVAGNAAANHTSRYVIYNEADSTVNLNFTVLTGHNVSTDDNSGNEIFIRDGANELIVAAQSAAIISVTRPAINAANTNGATILASRTRTSHGTVSADGESVFIQRVADAL